MDEIEVERKSSVFPNETEADSRDRAAYELSICLSTPDVTQMVRQALDDASIAKLVGTTEARAVRHWSEGVRPPRPAQELRLRITARLCGLVHDSEKPWQAKAWLFLPNPILDNRSPAAVLTTIGSAEDNEEADAASIVIAAKAFCQSRNSGANRSLRALRDI